MKIKDINQLFKDLGYKEKSINIKGLSEENKIYIRSISFITDCSFPKNKTKEESINKVNINYEYINDTLGIMKGNYIIQPFSKQDFIVLKKFIRNDRRIER